MLNKKEKAILKKAREKSTYGSIKFSVKCNLQVVIFIILISFIFLYKDNINLPLVYRFSFGFAMTLLIYLFGSWHSFGNIFLANKLSLIYIKIKIKKIVALISRK